LKNLYSPQRRRGRREDMFFSFLLRGQKGKSLPLGNRLDACACYAGWYSANCEQL